MAAPLLVMRGVKKSFLGVQALTDGNLEVQRGEIHAFCGSNGAGKSTLLGILMGFIAPDDGEILIDGRRVRFTDARQALDAGVAIVQQELSAIPHLTVAENIYLGAPPCRRGFVDFKRLNRQAEELLASLGFAIDPKAVMESLSVAAQQLVEIAKALSHRNANILIFDEPTSAIGEKDVERLFAALRSLAATGKGIIYVTHRLSEVFAIATAYTVFKDGARVACGRVCDIDRERLIELMIGGAMAGEYVKGNTPASAPLLDVKGLTRAPRFHDVDLMLHKGEILGIYGLVGSGRSELIETIYGLHRADGGSIAVAGKRLRGGGVPEAIAAGLAYVTEDRKDSGLVPCASVGSNLSLSILGRVQHWGIIRRKAEAAEITKAIGLMQIKTPGSDQLVRNLSGGNQQKVVLGRCILTDPKILLLDEPTLGVDVAAKKEIYRFMSDFAKQGGGIVMVSSDLEEVLAMSDRIMVLRHGEAGEAFARGEATSGKLMLAAA